MTTQEHFNEYTYRYLVCRFDLSGTGGGPLGGPPLTSASTGSPASSCVPKFEAKYEPNLSMQQQQQSSPISLTTVGQHTPQSASFGTLFERGPQSNYGTFFLEVSFENLGNWTLTELRTQLSPAGLEVPGDRSFMCNLRIIPFKLVWKCMHFRVKIIKISQEQMDMF